MTDSNYLFLNTPNRHPFSSPAIVHRLTRTGDESGLRAILNTDYGTLIY
jgi:hypothetical protein